MARKKRDEFYITDLWPMKPLRIDNGLRSVHAWHKWLREHPGYMHAEGTMIYVGPQGSGKTLSAVRYLLALMEQYPKAIVCTNIELTDFPFNAHLDPEATHGWAYNKGVEPEDNRPIVEYVGLDCLKFLMNDYQGVIYLIDELHLELNSLESRNIDINVMIEISQQRKQRKHIIGTSQEFMRLAKPLREQVRDIVLCRCLFGRMQSNRLLDGATAVETSGGHVDAVIRKKSFFWHTPAMYKAYDTYAKMKRYNELWQGREQVDSIYNPDGKVKYNPKKKVK